MTTRQRLLENEIIGARVASIRQSRELSQRGLASFMGWDRPTLSEIESGNRSLRAHELVRLCAYLECDYKDILAQPRKHVAKTYKIGHA